MGRFSILLSALEAVGLASGSPFEDDRKTQEAIEHATDRLLDKLHQRRQAILARVRELPAGTPTSAEAATKAKRVGEFEALQLLNEEWAPLDRAHRLLIEPWMGRPAIQLCYADTRRTPDQDERGRPVPYGPPVGSLARLVFLSTDADFWTPSAGATLGMMLGADQARGAAGQTTREAGGW
ncbi:MAG: hypothetical protein ACHQ0J_05125 [Candidatus Dormibacterales bacterium]